MTVSTSRLNKLEAERFDITYKLYPLDNLHKERAIMKRRARAQAEADNMERQARADQIEEIKQAYFNAGRYAAGARDVTAAKGFALVESGLL